MAQILQRQMLRHSASPITGKINREIAAQDHNPT
jgi:hypothetical protein